MQGTALESTNKNAEQPSTSSTQSSDSLVPSVTEDGAEVEAALLADRAEHGEQRLL